MECELNPIQLSHASICAPGGETSFGTRGGMLTSEPHLTRELIKPPTMVVQITTLQLTRVMVLPFTVFILNCPVFELSLPRFLGLFRNRGLVEPLQVLHDISIRVITLMASWNRVPAAGRRR